MKLRDLCILRRGRLREKRDYEAMREALMLLNIRANGSAIEVLEKRMGEIREETKSL